jgi:hypothetical protein
LVSRATLQQLSESNHQVKVAFCKHLENWMLSLIVKTIYINSASPA